jgi:hypothetical protein
MLHFDKLMRTQDVQDASETDYRSADDASAPSDVQPVAPYDF